MNLWRAATISWCFLSVPRIASSLLLAPFLLGLFVTGSSLALSFAIKGAPGSQINRASRHAQKNPMRKFLGVGAQRALTVCDHAQESCQVDRLGRVIKLNFELKFADFEASFGIENGKS